MVRTFNLDQFKTTGLRTRGKKHQGLITALAAQLIMETQTIFDSTSKFLFRHICLWVEIVEVDVAQCVNHEKFLTISEYAVL